MRFRRLVTAFLLGGATLVAPASTELVASDPASGASLTAVPQRIVLTFSEPVTLRANPLTVIGPEAVMWTIGTPSIAGPVITAPVRAAGPLGAYILTYRVVSGDGDNITGTVAFTLTDETAPTTTPSPAPPLAVESTSDTGTPAWVWLLGTVVVLAAGVAVALRMTRTT